MARSLAPNRERGTIAVVAAADFSLAIVCLALLVLWKIPPWLVVVVAAIAGAGIAAAQGGG
jgi:chromate transporter